MYLKKIYRDRDRASTVLYPTSTTDPFFWPNGLGQLTPRGQLQHIRLGQFLRERYSELLNSTYVASEVTIRSTDYERTLMSAYSNLVGLYPTSKDKLDSILSGLNENDTWPEVLPWQPIPVHTVPRSSDYLMGTGDCPRFNELLEELGKSEMVKNLTERFQGFFDQLEIWTGSKIDYFSDALAIADTVLVEDLYNLSPPWANSSVLAELRLILDLSYYDLFDSPEMNQIHVGNNTYALTLEYLNSTNGRTTQPIPLPRQYFVVS
ncbi:unnamed protein product [Adineta steineri]|uniref:acid phosphatase n=1 Tax=Adineta steineri TaxID=433720 RepID=A0A814ESA9_9BILA|nr:unnamed protein product [Adineta steineri]